MLDGTKILRETWGENVLVPLYDNEESVCGICFNGEYFYFQKNLQGDIISVTDKDANEVAKYTYDAWGVCTIVSDTSACNIATVNPFRYRGYYYDNEIGMYYLQSRYYNPRMSRFVNVDGAEYVNYDSSACSTNIFPYCNNDCVNGFDPTGHGVFKAVGVQIAMSWKRLVVGFEILWDTSRWKPYFFFFVGGASKNFLKEAERALKEDLIYCMKRVPKNSMNALKKFSNFGLSISAVAVFGNRFSSFPKTYTGWFTSASLSVRHVTISGAVGCSGRAVIGSFGLGITTSVLSINLSQTYYWQISKDTRLSDFFEPLKRSFANIMAWLQLFTFLLV